MPGVAPTYPALAAWWAYENKSRALSGPELKALDY